VFKRMDGVGWEVNEEEYPVASHTEELLARSRTAEVVDGLADGVLERTEVVVDKELAAEELFTG